MSWQILYWNQEKVREALQRGEYDDASLTSWGRLDDLVALAEGLGVLKELQAIQPDLTRAGDIPRWFIHHALFWRTVVGDESLAAMQEGLFRDTGVLRLLGCTAREIRQGFAAQRNQGAHTPCHVDSLRYSLKHTPAGQFSQAFTRCRARWIQAGFVKRRGTYILDATKIEVDGEYEGAGAMTVREEILDAQGKRHRRKIVTKGFKLVTLSYLVPKRKLLVVMAYRVLPIQQHEITVSEELVEEVVTAVGEGAIRLLLLDRGFLDGERLGRWQGRGMDVLVPVKHNMAVLADMQGLATLPPDAHIVPAARRGAKDAQGQPLEDVQLLGFRGLETLESYPGALNGLLVTAFRGQELLAEQQWGAITTLPVRTPAEVLAAFDAYDDRSLVENTEYRELKQGYRLPTFIGKDASSIAAHLFFEVLLYSVIALYQQQRAHRFVAEGIRRLRRVAWKERLEVVVYVGCWYGLFEVREFATLLGRPPTGRLDATRVHLRPRRRP
jgi:Transposase DDE domain